MLHAIARCVLDLSTHQLPDTPLCITLQEACSFIESNADLDALKKVLIAEIHTSFYCSICHEVLDGFMLANNQVFIFKLTMKKQFIAYPVIYRDNLDPANNKTSCKYCQYSFKNIDLPIYKQVFHQCPMVLLVSFTDSRICTIERKVIFTN